MRRSTVGTGRVVMGVVLGLMVSACTVTGSAVPAPPIGYDLDDLRAAATVAGNELWDPKEFAPERVTESLGTSGGDSPACQEFRDGTQLLRIDQAQEGDVLLKAQTHDGGQGLVVAVTARVAVGEMSGPVLLDRIAEAAAECDDHTYDVVRVLAGSGSGPAMVDVLRLESEDGATLTYDQTLMARGNVIATVVSAGFGDDDGGLHQQLVDEVGATLSALPD